MNQLDPKETNRTVFVIEDHPIVCFGLVEMIKDLAPYASIRQFSTLREAGRAAQQTPPALLISDFYLKDVTTTEFVPLFEQIFPHVPVLVTNNDDNVMRELSRQKLDRFTVFSKYTPFPRLVDILREGLQVAGFRVIASAPQADMVRPSHAAHSNIGVGGKNKPLTRKQVEVLEYISSGMSNREIADALNISSETVKGHVKDILERLQVKNRLEAAVFYRQAIRQHAYTH